MRKSFLLILIALCITACIQGSGDYPQQRIADSLMVHIIADGFVLQSAFAETFAVKKDSMSEIYSQQLLDNYEIDMEMLDETMSWYYQHPSMLDTLYMNVLLLLESMQTSTEVRAEQVN